MQDHLPVNIRIMNVHLKDTTFLLIPPSDTMLDVLKRNHFDVISIGKIYDIFLLEKESVKVYQQKEIQTVSNVCLNNRKKILTESVF